MGSPVRSAVVEQLLGAAGVTDAVAHEATADPAHLSSLHPDERLAAATMSEGRAAEYATARACARASLEILGSARPVPRLPSGAPDWPSGVSGSISHTRGFCAAVATRSPERVIGLDAEQVDRVRPELARRILTGHERRQLDGLTTRDAGRRVAISFAAKEAFYKAHHQLDARYLGFDVIAFEPIAGDLSEVQLLSVAVGEADDDRGVDPVRVANTIIAAQVVGRHVVAAATIRR